MPKVLHVVTITVETDSPQGHSDMDAFLKGCGLFDLESTHAPPRMNGRTVEVRRTNYISHIMGDK